MHIIPGQNNLREISRIRLRPSQSTTTGWTPANESGLLAWFKADAITGLNNGDPVSTWTDSSGNSRHATQTGTARPTYQTNQINGNPWVLFSNASSQFLEFGTDSLAAKGSARTVVWVGYTSFGVNTFRSLISLKDGAAAGNNLVVFMSGTPPATNFVQTNFGMTANGGQVGWRQGATNAFTTPSAAGIVIYDGTNNSNATNWTGYFNNAAFTTSTPGGNFNAGTSSRNAIGAFPTAAAGLFWDGPIAEVIVWDHAISAATRSNVALYISAKYNIAQSAGFWASFKDLVTQTRNKIF